MIKSWEKLGDILADFETRLLLLENSLPNTPISEQVSLKDEQMEKPWASKQWDTVRQIQAKVIFLQNKLNEHLARKKRRAQY